MNKPEWLKDINIELPTFQLALHKGTNIIKVINQIHLTIHTIISWTTITNQCDITLPSNLQINVNVILVDFNLFIH